VDVETTGTNPDRDKIIELGICLFEYDRQNGRIYKVLGSSEWLEDPGFPISPEITTITAMGRQPPLIAFLVCNTVRTPISCD
jgi:DNA polymerase-3 subunit epsilon